MTVFKQLLNAYKQCLLRGDHSNGAAAYLALVAEYEQAARRAPAEPVPQLDISDAALTAIYKQANNEVGKARPLTTESIFRAMRAVAALSAAPQPPEAAHRAPAEPVPQWGKAGTCEWYDGYADHSDGGGPYKERVLYTAPQGWKPVPVELLERIQESLGSFVSDQGWAQSDMDTADALDGLLAAAPSKPLTDAQIKEGRDAVNDDPDYRPEPWAFRKGVKFAERMHGITKEKQG